MICRKFSFSHQHTGARFLVNLEEGWTKESWALWSDVLNQNMGGVTLEGGIFIGYSEHGWGCTTAVLRRETLTRRVLRSEASGRVRNGRTGGQRMKSNRRSVRCGWYRCSIQQFDFVSKLSHLGQMICMICMICMVYSYVMIYIFQGR